MDSWVVVDNLVPIVLSNVPGCIVEIGLGNSTIILAKHAKNYNRKHYACDFKKSTCDWVKSNINYDGLLLYNCDSFSFLKNFKDSPAIIFIDGNHRYNVVRKETELLLPKLVPGGIGFFHDTFICEKWYNRYQRKGKDTDTYKIRQDLEKNETVWCMTFPYTAAWCGLTVVLKKEIDRPYYQK